MKKITYNGESKILIALCNSINEIIDNLGNAGDGDMKKSVYDTNGDGIVDNAEKVNNHSVDANVPEDAKFTDSNTTYTLGKSDGKITLTDSDGLKQEVDVPSTDTNTTYTMTLDGSKLTLTDSNGNAQNVTLPSGGSGGGTGMDWTLLKTVTGTTEVSLDGVDFDELYFDVKIKNSNDLILHFNTTVHKADITDTTGAYSLTGGYSANNDGYNVGMSISNASTNLRYCWIDNNEYLDSAIVSVYYGKKADNTVKITSDSWTPTNEYINGERLYKRYFEVLGLTFTTQNINVWKSVLSLEDMGIKSANAFIHLQPSIYDRTGLGSFLIRADHDYQIFYSISEIRGLCVVIGRQIVNRTFDFRCILTTVESNLTTMAKS